MTDSPQAIFAMPARHLDVLDPGGSSAEFGLLLQRCDAPLDVDINSAASFRGMPSAHCTCILTARCHRIHGHARDEACALGPCRTDMCVTLLTREVRSRKSPEPTGDAQVLRGRWCAPAIAMAKASADVMLRCRHHAAVRTRLHVGSNMMEQQQEQEEEGLRRGTHHLLFRYN